MSTLGNAASIRAPHGANTTDNAKANTQAVATASTAAVDTGISGNLPEYVTFICTQNAYIRFGIASVAAATSDDWPLVANISQTFRIYPKQDRYFTVIRASADGVLKWYRSS